MKNLGQEDPTIIIKQLISGAPKGMKGLARSIYVKQENERLALYYKLTSKFARDPPDINDVRILSQAVYFLRNKIFGEETKILFASTDHHFSKIREEKELNDFVPKIILKELNIYCGWPDDILNILIGKKDLLFL